MSETFITDNQPNRRTWKHNYEIMKLETSRVFFALGQFFQVHTEQKLTCQNARSIRTWWKLVSFSSVAIKLSNLLTTLSICDELTNMSGNGHSHSLSPEDLDTTALHLMFQLPHLLSFWQSPPQHWLRTWSKYYLEEKPPLTASASRTQCHQQANKPHWAKTSCSPHGIGSPPFGASHSSRVLAKHKATNSGSWGSVGRFGTAQTRTSLSFCEETPKKGRSFSLWSTV